MNSTSPSWFVRALFGLALVAPACAAPATDTSSDGVDEVSGEEVGGGNGPSSDPGSTCVETMMCVVGEHWSAADCACVGDNDGPPGPGACTTDADCRTFSDYCTGCDCRVLSTSDADPTCDGPGVRCFMDPCANATAACVNGTCSLQ